MAETPERFAAMVLPAEAPSAELAENLTEVLIARIVEKREVNVAGADEFRQRIDFMKISEAIDCVEDVVCLSRIGASLGVSWIVLGTVRQGDDKFLFHLAMTNVSTGAVQGRFFRSIPAEKLSEIIGAVQEGVDQLLSPPPRPARVRIQTVPEGADAALNDTFIGKTPISSGVLEPGQYMLRVDLEGFHRWQKELHLSAGDDLSFELDDEMKRIPVWPRYVFWAGVGGAALSLVGSVVLGTQSQEEKSFPTRLELMNDLDRREKLASTANWLFISSAVFSAISGTALYIRLSDQEP